MKRIRQGNSINFRYSVYRSVGGLKEPEELTGINVAAILQNRLYGSRVDVPFLVEGNVLTARIPGIPLLKTGVYNFSLSYQKDGWDFAIDVDAFRIVDSSAKVGGEDACPDVEAETVELDGTLDFGIGSGTGIEQVQADWGETNPESKAFIRRKPVLSKVATSGSYEDLSGRPTIPVLPEGIVIDANYVHTDNNYTSEEKEKLAGLENYNDTPLRTALQDEINRATEAESNLDAAVKKVASDFATFLSSDPDADNLINRWQEVTAFLNGITEDKTLSGMLLEMKTEINESVVTKLAGYYTAARVDELFVKKLVGSRLMTEEEATKLADLQNYDDTEIKKEIAGKIDRVELDETNGLVFLSGNTAISSISIDRLKEALGTLTPEVIVPSSILKLSLWSFSKDGTAYSNVSLPHTCNAIDGESTSMYKGDTFYKTAINANPDLSYYLLVTNAGQVAEVFLNNISLKKHFGGYTGFLVPLLAANAGNNELLIKCNNQRSLDNIPVSADFNFNNGLFGEVYLVGVGKIHFDTASYGKDRFHLVQTSVTASMASFTIKAKIRNAYTTEKSPVVSITVKDKEGAPILAWEEACTTPAGGEYDLSQDFTLSSPHLWNGIKDPYLYTVEVNLSIGNTIVDTLTRKTGFRYFSMSKTEGFQLNGETYLLRGVSLHQDYQNVASAMTEAQYDTDYANIMDIGANFVRLAHYPHNEYAFQKCDELGLIVQTEIPWVNECGVNATDTYFDNIKNNMREMITDLYNHPCIVFWGMSNELGGSHANYPQGSFDASKAQTWQNDLYAYSKELEPVRYVGYVTDRPDQTGWNADWVGMNIYKGWYGGTFGQFGTTIDAQKDTNFMAVTEYGAGANPATHSDNPMSTTNTGSGGARHDEEYQNLFHESYLEQITSRPWIQFTSLWVLNDFAVAGRNEGGTPYINDKGIITRSREIKKDSYFLYKAAWTAAPMVYITSRRFTDRTTEGIVIKVYSNCDSVTLLQDGVEKQTLTSPTKAGVVFTFNEVKFTGPSHTFGVVGTKNGKEASDEVVFKTSVSIGSISVDKTSLTLKPGESDTITVTTDCAYTITKTGDFFSVQDNAGSVTVTIHADATGEETGSLVISTGLDSVEVSIAVVAVTLLDHITNNDSEACALKFDLGIVPTINTKIETKFKFSDHTGNPLKTCDFLGCRESPSDPNAFYFLLSTSLSENYKPNIGTVGRSMVANLTNPRVIYFDKDVIKLDGEQKAEMGATTLNATKNMYLFQFNTPQTRNTAFYGPSDFYYLKVWEGEVLIGEFVPCLIGDKIALYNKVNGETIDNMLSGANITYQQ